MDHNIGEVMKMYNYNPLQTRMDNIDSQINMLQQQKMALQNYNQPAPIQQTFIQQPSGTTKQYDFNGLWCNGIEEAKSVANDNLPLVIFDKQEDRFYMKQINGVLKAFDFKEVPIKEKENNDITELKQLVENLKHEVASLKGEKNEQFISADE